MGSVPKSKEGGLPAVVRGELRAGVQKSVGRPRRQGAKMKVLAQR